MKSRYRKHTLEDEYMLEQISRLPSPMKERMLVAVLPKLFRELEPQEQSKESVTELSHEDRAEQAQMAARWH